MMTYEEIAALIPGSVIEFLNSLRAIVQQNDLSNEMITFEYEISEAVPETTRIVCRWIELYTATLWTADAARGGPEQRPRRYPFPKNPADLLEGLNRSV